MWRNQLIDKGGGSVDKLRYPIGEFQAVQEVTPEQRKGWIQSIAEMPLTLRRAVQGFREEQLDTPYRPGGWTVRQVVHHLADNDMNAYIRFKRALTEEHPAAGSYRQDLWAELSDYRDTPIATSLTLIESLHGRFVTLLVKLSPADLQRSFWSPTYGDMTLDAALQRYSWHGRHHIAQITSVSERQLRIQENEMNDLRK